jgi:hypothetical protein
MLENTVVGKIAYSDTPSSPRALSFSVPLTLRDIIRPAQIQTADFGAAWPQHTIEKKVRVAPAAVAGPADYMSKMQRLVGLHAVQVIGVEGICAGNVVGTPAMALVHARIAPGVVDLTVGFFLVGGGF